MIQAALLGDVVVRREGDQVTILEAPWYALIASELLPPRDGWAMRMDGECVVLANQVWYLPVEPYADGHCVVVELVRDDRPS